ncbi:MAG: lytic transglycosylase domain-containing protein [Acidobacteriota bacterium]|nr:lytic transglycosylase domain-containing protein [Acidobacteriota bacterium]
MNLAWTLLSGPMAYGQLGSRGAMDNSAAKQQASISSQRQSTAVQAAAVHKQGHKPPLAETFFLLDPPPANPTISPEPECEPLSAMEMNPLIDSAAQKEGLSSDLLHAVIRQESAYRPCAVSLKGALGLMQLMPATARSLGVDDPFDPKENVEGGARLLRDLMDRYTGDLSRVLGAYNAGTARVDAADGVPQIPETLNYVDRIMRNLGAR